MEKAETVDFAIFIFTPDDLIIIRDEKKLVVRDNILFELGLFTGTIGKRRCFIVKPRDVELHFPTDLLGLTPADYDGNRSDDDLTSAVNHPCILIKKEVAHLGLISQDLDIQKNRRKKSGYDYKLGDIEHRLLVKILANYADATNGVSIWRVFDDLEGIDKGILALTLIKLERLGYVDKAIDMDTNGQEFYTVAITADGIDYLLENEHLIKGAEINNSPQSSSDDDIPF